MLLGKKASPRSCRTISFNARPFTTSSTTSGSSYHHHRSLCFSLADQLLNQGLISSAQGVMDRIITKHSSSSLPDAISTIDFAALRGLTFNSHSLAALLTNFVTSGQPDIAEALYTRTILDRAMNVNWTCQVWAAKILIKHKLAPCRSAFYGAVSCSSEVDWTHMMRKHPRFRWSRSMKQSLIGGDKSSTLEPVISEIQGE